ncbi:MAG: hypothetical protein AAGF89_07130 [Bacteroidota bacterium]
MRQALVFLAILVAAVAIYWPILRIARADITARSRAGLGNGLLFAVLLIPLVGPVLYLVFRKYFVVE